MIDLTLAASVAAYVADHGGGTFEHGTLLPFAPTSGYAVGLANGTAAIHAGHWLKLADSLYRVAQEWSAPFVGAWAAPDGRVHIDPVEYVSDRERAIALGRSRGQLAVWDFGNAQEITL